MKTKQEKNKEKKSLLTFSLFPILLNFDLLSNKNLTYK